MELIVYKGKIKNFARELLIKSNKIAYKYNFKLPKLLIFRVLEL